MQMVNSKYIISATSCVEVREAVPNIDDGLALAPEPGQVALLESFLDSVSFRVMVVHHNAVLFKGCLSAVQLYIWSIDMLQHSVNIEVEAATDNSESNAGCRALFDKLPEARSYLNVLPNELLKLLFVLFDEGILLSIALFHR